MSTSTPRALARELADLARLRLDDDEAQALGVQVQTVLRYIETLRTVDVDGVPEYGSAERADSGLRADVRGPMLDAERVLSGVPARRGRHLSVPKFKA